MIFIVLEMYWIIVNGWKYMSTVKYFIARLLN